MAETDYVHEPPIEGDIHSAAWINGYNQAIAAVQAHGLPDHEERVASVVALAASKSLLHEEWMTVEEVIDAYHAWTKGEGES